METMTLILLFHVSKFDRRELDRKSDDELFEIIKTSDDTTTRFYELKEFCEYCNDQEIDIDSWWMYTITR